MDQAHGFPDPVKTPHVRRVLKGIAALHPATEKRAKPMQITQREMLAVWLDPAGALTPVSGGGLRSMDCGLWLD
jgi:hypothetical protein